MSQRVNEFACAASKSASLGEAARLRWAQGTCTTSVAPAARILGGRIGAGGSHHHDETNLTTTSLTAHPNVVSRHCSYNSDTHGTYQPQWFTRCFSGAASVTPTTSAHHRTHANSCCSPQALPHDYGSSASKCARSSTRNLSGCTPSSPASVAALATGSRALSTANSGSWPTDETSCWRSEHGGRSAKRLQELLLGSHRRTVLREKAEEEDVRT
jgi:hypothetical protein